MTEDHSNDVRPLDARSLRGLAHPLRMRLMTALREYGPATASQLADRLGESSGATSYHLRQLATYGFVEDDPGRGTGRERWWKTVYRGTRFDSVDEIMQHPDPAVRGAMSTFLYEHAATQAEQLSTWLGTMHEWPQEWRSAWEMSDFILRLTPELAKQLVAETHELIEGYRDRLARTEEEAAAGSAPDAAAEQQTAEQQAAGQRGSDAKAPDEGATAGPAMVRIHLRAFPRPSS